MNFLVDAQLPSRLAAWLVARGHTATHTLELPRRNNTADADLVALADRSDAVVVGKDADFQISHELGRGPKKLLLITTGNIHNNELLELFRKNEDSLLALLSQHSFLELSRTELIVHG